MPDFTYGDFQEGPICEECLMENICPARGKYCQDCIDYMKIPQCKLCNEKTPTTALTRGICSPCATELVG